MDIAPRSLGFIAHTEMYEHVGDVRCFVGPSTGTAQQTLAAIR